MLGHVLIPHKWKGFVFHRGCSFNSISILSAGLIAGGREGRESRHGKAEKMDVMLLVWGANGKWAAQRVQCGRVRAKLGQKTKVCLQVALVKAL